MVPLILPTDKLIVKKALSYKVNDVVVFKKRGRLIAHRLIYYSPSKDYLITKGDNNLKADGKIKANQILGKVEKIKRDSQVINLSHLYFSQSSAYLKQLNTVSEEFTKNNIAYIILKGLPLHLHFSKSPPKRLYLDADILIKKTDRLRAHKIFNKLGFTSYHPTLFKKKVKNPTQISFVKETEPFPTIIDLHFEPAVGFTKIGSFNRLLPFIERFTYHLFKNVSLITIEKTSFPVLAEETLIVYLLLHLFHHNFQGAHRMQFIHDLVKREDISWREVEKIATKFNLKNLIFPATLMLEHYYHTPVHRFFSKRMKPSLGIRAFSQAVNKSISPFSSGTRTQEGAKRFILLILLSPAPFSQKIKILFHKDTRDYLLSTIKSFFLRTSRNSSKSRFAFSSETL